MGRAGGSDYPSFSAEGRLLLVENPSSNLNEGPFASGRPARAASICCFSFRLSHKRRAGQGPSLLAHTHSHNSITPGFRYSRGHPSGLPLLSNSTLLVSHSSQPPGANRCGATGGRPSSRVTSRHLDHGRSSRVFISRSNRPYGLTCSQIDGETVWILTLVHTARLWPPVRD